MAFVLRDQATADGEKGLVLLEYGFVWIERGEAIGHLLLIAIRPRLEEMWIFQISGVLLHEAWQSG